MSTRRSSSASTWLIIILTVLALAGGGIFLYVDHETGIVSRWDKTANWDYTDLFNYLDDRKAGVSDVIALGTTSYMFSVRGCNLIFVERCASPADARIKKARPGLYGMTWGRFFFEIHDHDDIRVLRRHLGSVSA